MPIYEYSCAGCGCTTEAWQKLSDPPLSDCASCGGKMKKLISRNSFHLKGSGWYVTDYAGKSAKGENPDKQADSGKEAGSDKTGDGAASKGDAEPAV